MSTDSITIDQVAEAHYKTEKEFQAAVVKHAKMVGWMVYHTWNSRHSPAGFPDLILLRHDRMVVAELKRGNEKVGNDQMLWLTAFAEAGADSYVWRGTGNFQDIVDVLHAAKAKVSEQANWIERIQES